MKKVVLMVVSFILVLTLSGCGKETLSCTKSGLESGMQMDQEVVADFNNNVVTNMDMDIKVNVGEQYKNYISTFKAALENQYKTYSDNGAKVNITTQDDLIDIKINFDVAKMTNKQRKNLNMTDIFGTKSATKKELEKQGYTCK